jgi:hypothetical protein
MDNVCQLEAIVDSGEISRCDCHCGGFHAGPDLSSSRKIMTMPARIIASEIVIVGPYVVLQGFERFLRDRSCRMRREVCGYRSCRVM